MKRILSLCLIIFSVYVFTSCEGKHVPPAKIGSNVFEMLKQMDTLSEDGFKDYFLPFPEIEKTIKGIGYTAKKRFNKLPISDELYAYEINRLYKNLKKRTVFKKIDWKNIQYVDFTYDKESDYGITIVRGMLYFENRSDPYSVDIIWLSNSQTAGLMGIGIGRDF